MGSMLKKDDSDKQMGAFFDRLEWFPTFGNGVNCSALDFVYFTANNMTLDGVSKTLDFEDKVFKNIQNEIKKIKKNPKDEDVEENINVKCKDLLCLPNENSGSDHLPIAAKFILSNICPPTKQKECDCCTKLKKNNAVIMKEWMF